MHIHVRTLRSRSIHIHTLTVAHCPMFRLDVGAYAHARCARAVSKVNCTHVFHATPYKCCDAIHTCILEWGTKECNGCIIRNDDSTWELCATINRLIFLVTIPHVTSVLTHTERKSCTSVSINSPRDEYTFVNDFQLTVCLLT